MTHQFVQLVRDRSGHYRAGRSRSRITEAEILNKATEIVETRVQTGQEMVSTGTAKQVFQLRLGCQDREVFSVAFLDNGHRVLSIEDLFFGTVNGAPVYPRIVVQRALALNAVAVVMAHNHPSGNSRPSRADREITARLQKALQLVEIRVLDHLVIGDGSDICSFAERGLL